jgi:N-acetylglucosamine-6-sulfatase
MSAAGRLRIVAIALLALGALAALYAALPGGSEAGKGAAGARPNIVLVVTDDQTLASFNARTMPYTMGAVAGAGTTFANAVVTTPLCCPSRATMLTGQYGHNNGIVNNNPGYPALRDKQNVLPEWLDLAGYETLHVGRYLNEYPKGRNSKPAPGWERWVTMLEPRRYYDYILRIGRKVVEFGDKAKDYATRVLTGRAADLIREYAPREQPFFLQFDQMAPHSGTGLKRGPCRPDEMADPGPGDYDPFAADPLPTPPSFNEEDISDKPTFVQKLPPTSERRISEITDRYRCASGALFGVDRSMAAIDSALSKAGVLDETVLIYISDNGFFYGEHRLRREKIRPYEEALHVPFAIRVPPGVLGAPTVPGVSELVANIDLVPTILELTGAAPCLPNGSCRVMDGRSLVPLLLGQGGWPADRGVGVEFRTGDEKFGTSSSCEYHGIRTLRYAYFQHTRVPNPVTDLCEPADERELYDLAEDPYQLSNLYPTSPLTPAAAAQEQLHGRMSALSVCAGIEGRDPAPPSGHYCE